MIHIGLIEWDGKKPPSVYYQRLGRMGLKVRGNKDEAVIPRRMTYVDEDADGEFWKSNIGESAVIVQEGAVISSSRSLVRIVCALAKEHGAKLAFVARASMEDLEEFSLDQDDIDALQRVNSVHGHVGRRAGEKMDYVVCCLEEAQTFQVNGVWDVSNCPKCHGTNIRRRVGIPHVVKPYSGKKVTDPFDLFEYWVVTRFAHGVYETPMESPEGADPVALADMALSNEVEHSIVNLIQNSPTFMEKLKLVKPKTALDMMDAAFCGRMFIPREVRQKARLSALTECFSRGADPTKARMSEKENDLDIFDTVAVLGERTVIPIYMRDWN
jgi:hypothetical protein